MYTKIMNKKKIIFDTDIGCDDAVALVALLLNENIEIEAITCVKGNLKVDDVVSNALKVTHLCDKDIPVYKGCNTPMVRDMLKGRDHNTIMQRIRMEVDGKPVVIHEPSFNLPLPERKPEKKHAVSYIVDRLTETNEKIDIVAIGPLTNIAMAIRMEPSIIDNIGTIYIMGGGLYKGNRTPVAEANFYDDPEAAEIVLTSGAKCLIVPLEACEMGVTYTNEDLEEIKKVNNKISDFLYEELHGYIDRCNLLFNESIKSCCVYDYAAVAPLIDESVILKKKQEVVRVDFSAGMSDGQMVVDRRGNTPQLSTEIVYEMDSTKLHNILLEELKNWN